MAALPAASVSTALSAMPTCSSTNDIFIASQSSDALRLTILGCEQTQKMISQLVRSTPENSSNLICSQNQKKRRRLQFDVECPEETDGDDETSKAKKPKSYIKKDKPSFIVKSKEMRAFFNLLDDSIISSFLAHDKCRRISDKYLLAMTFAYFKRANFTIREYNRINFFRALYLANDMEEDEEDLKYEIFPWALGPNWQQRYPGFLLKRDQLWKRIGYRAVVSKKCCDEVMAIEPDHTSWKRVRPEHHGGAGRDYMRDPSDTLFPRGPSGSPRYCSQCDTSSVEYDSASPDSISWYISSQDSSPGSPFPKVLVVTAPSRFDMEGLKETLPDDLIWAHGEE